MKSKVLIVEDNIHLSLLYKEALENDFDVEIARSLEEAHRFLDYSDAIILDLQLPDGDGISIIPEAIKINPTIAIFVITAYGTISRAVEAIRLGALDFLEKPVDIEELITKLKKHLSNNNVEIVAQSPSMKKILRLAQKVATTPFPVLITGETGVGKEILARYIHKNSNRSPFVTLNCASIPKELTESLLFGHVKGAFTGATENKKGLVCVAQGGTLFLDEIGELPLSIQPKLLRFLDQKTYQILGSTKEEKADVRIIAATNRDLKREIERGVFREDLYFRLATFPIKIPPLRDRKEDILALIEKKRKELSHILKKPLSIEEDAKLLLLSLRYPGNVRELFNILERAAIVADKLISAEIIKSVIELDNIDKEEMNCTSQEDFWSQTKLETEKKEREIILAALAAAGWNKAAAARALKINYKTLLKRMKKLGISSKPQTIGY